MEGTTDFVGILVSTLPPRKAKSPAHIYIVEYPWKGQELLGFCSSMATITQLAVLHAVIYTELKTMFNTY